ncbi:importin beta-3, putative [Entamoeba invadens IP1]|uniref:importin beta-3, putative n=1 Tax=Entamoeba invadens IP1 TaxID=370355 RepID=UPI0002C3E826|nr:importin beta-3, putative [Entamoeba invadens IP1]ELP90589.1 importin beta-3, putative [Entamoeba invadens IP1]|eukprot:XP_004257360.1 importin beta-3, putative [Entamoeba invadens IP1]
MNFVGLLQALKSPDNTIRKNAEQLYNQLMTENPDLFLQNHVELMKSPEEETRHFVMVLFHAALTKKQDPLLFTRFSPNAQQNLFVTLFNIFQNETSKRVATMLVEIFAVTALHVRDLNDGKGNIVPYYELMFSIINSPNEVMRYLSLSTISSLFLSLGEEKQYTECDNIVTLINRGLNDNSFIVSMAALDFFATIAVIYSPETRLGQLQPKLLPLMQSSVQLFGKVLNSNNHDMILEALKNINNFAFFPKELLKPYVMYFVNGLLVFCNAQAFDLKLRQTAMSTTLDLISPYSLLIKRDQQTLAKILSLLFEWDALREDDLNEWEKEDTLDEDDADLADGLVQTAGELFGGEVMYRFAMSQVMDTWKKEYASLRFVFTTLNPGIHFYKKNIEELIKLVHTKLGNTNPRVRHMAYSVVNSMVSEMKKKCKRYSKEIISFIQTAFVDTSVKNQTMGCDILATVLDVDLISPQNMEEYAVGFFQTLIQFVSNSASFPLIDSALASINFMIHCMCNRLTAVFPALFEFFKTKQVQVLTLLNAPNNDPKQKKNLLSTESRIIEGLSMMVYACSNSITQEVAMQIFLQVYSVFNAPADQQEVLLPFAQKAFSRLASTLKQSVQPYLNTIVPSLVEGAGKRTKIRFETGEEEIDENEWASSAICGLNYGVKTSEVIYKADCQSTLTLFVEELKESMFPYYEMMIPLSHNIKYMLDDTVRQTATCLMSKMLTVQLATLKQTNPSDYLVVFKNSKLYKEVFLVWTDSIPKEPESTIAIAEIDAFTQLVKSQGNNGLTEEEMQYLFTMFADLFEGYLNITQDKKKNMNEGVQQLTGEEVDMLTQDSENDSDALMASQYLFKNILRFNEKYFDVYNRIFHQWVVKYYKSGNEDYISTAVMFLSDLITAGKRTDMAVVLVGEFINLIKVSGSDTQFNTLLCMCEIFRYYDSTFLQPFVPALLDKLQYCLGLKGTEKNDIYEASVLCQGELMMRHPDLCKQIGIVVDKMLNVWFFSLKEIEGVKDVAMTMIINGAVDGCLKIDTVDKLSYFITFIARTLLDDSLDLEQVDKLKLVLIAFKKQFSDEVFNRIWNSLMVEEKEELYELVK